LKFLINSFQYVLHSFFDIENPRYNPRARDYHDGWVAPNERRGSFNRHDEFRERERDTDMRPCGRGIRPRRISNEARPPDPGFGRGGPSIRDRHRDRDREWDRPVGYNYERSHEDNSFHRKFGRSEERSWDRPSSRSDDWDRDHHHDRGRERRRDLSFEEDCRGNSHDRGSEFSPREYDRDPHYSRAPSRSRDQYEHSRPGSSPIDLENSYDRRPAFERRERDLPVATLGEPEIHEYNHENPVPITVPALAAQDQDMRTQAGLLSPGTAPFISIDPALHQQQQMLNHLNPAFAANMPYQLPVGMNNMNQFNPAAGMHPGMTSVSGMAGHPTLPNNAMPGMRMANNMQMPNMNYSARAGLLPTPMGGFNYPGGSRPVHPQGVVSNYSMGVPQREVPAERMKEIFQQKAQQCFSRNAVRPPGHIRPPGPGNNANNQAATHPPGARGGSTFHSDPRDRARRNSGEDGGASNNKSPESEDNSTKSLRARLEGLKGFRIKPKEPIRKVDKITKIQDFRKQVEKEQPIRLGRSGNNNKRGYSEEPPNEVPSENTAEVQTSTEATRASPEKEKSRSPSRESRSSPSRRSTSKGKANKKETKDELRENKEKKDKGKEKTKKTKIKAGDEVREKKQRKVKDKGKKSADKVTESAETVPTTSKKSVFRIPKLKKPPTPVPSPQPNLEELSDSFDSTDENNAQMVWLIIFTAILHCSNLIQLIFAVNIHYEIYFVFCSPKGMKLHLL